MYKFPTWQWEAGEPSRRREFLPADKQYLVSRNGAFPRGSVALFCASLTSSLRTALLARAIALASSSTRFCLDATPAVPCLRRVSQLGQQGGGARGGSSEQDEYAEMLMDLAAEAGEPGAEGEEWVATHTQARGTRL